MTPQSAADARLYARALTATLLLVAGATASPQAIAQAVLRLTTPSQATCVATTDYQGVRLRPNSLQLEATGVTITGCGAPTNFGTTATITATQANVGDTIAVQWSANTNATICSYAGPRTGVAGWAAGSLACQGGTCAGLHSTNVTFTAAGTYTFMMVCTNSTGYAQTTVHVQ